MLPQILTILLALNTKIRAIEEFNNFETLPGAETLQIAGVTGKIHKGTFPKLTQLEKLSITLSKITEIENGALCLSKIQSIRLLDNEIVSKLTRDTFTGCQTVENLTLINNRGAVIGEFALSGLANLQNLYISRQDVPHLTNTFFLNLSSLKKVTLQFCNIRNVISGAFDNLDSLRELVLVHNKFKSISGVLHKLTSLESLILANNRLEDFPWADLKGLHHIVNVDLSANSIRHFEVNNMAASLENVVDLEIWGNPVESCEERSLIVRKLESELPRTRIYFDVLPNGTCL